MKECFPVKISKHAYVLSNDPLMHSNSTRFKKRSAIPLEIRLYNKNTPTHHLTVLCRKNAATLISIVTIGIINCNQKETLPDVDGRPRKYSIEKNQNIDKITPIIIVINT